MGVIEENQRLLHRIPEYIRDKKTNGVYTHRGIKTNGYSPVEILIQQTNSIRCYTGVIIFSEQKYRKLYMSSDTPEIYADGADLMFGTYISKLNFYSVVATEKNDDQKGELSTELKVQIAIPTSSILKLCTSILKQFKADEKEIIAMIDNEKEEFINILQELTINISDEE
jgi:hypothetical protein